MASGILNFDVGNKITGVNVIDGHLLFTDNRNEPRKINIARFRDDGDHTSTTQIYGRDFQERDISVIKKHPSKAPTFSVTDTDTDNAEFDGVFPRLSYRWHFKDNEHSPYAPFTMPVYQSDSALDYKDMYETGEIAFLKNIVNEFTVTVPVNQDDIISVDLLYTESISSTVYIVETKTVLASDITTGTIDFTVNSRNFFKALPPNQLNRIFDEVPRRALAQDMVGNRVVYANYLEGYNNTSVTATLGIANQANGIAVPGVRTNSSYNIGVAFIDKMGRMGGLIDLGKIETPFFNADPIKLTAQLSGTAPAWATRYRYYIKDVTGPMYNIKSFGAFDNEDFSENEIWIAVASEDVNKVQEGDYIHHKAKQRIDTFPGYEGLPNAGYGQAHQVLYRVSTYNKRKVLEVKSEAPESVKYGLINKNLVAHLEDSASTTHYAYAANDGYYSASKTPAVDDTEIAINGTALLTTIGDELGQSKVVYIALGNVTGSKFRVTGVEAIKVGTGGTTDGTLIKLAAKLNSSSVSGATTSTTVKVYSTQFEDEKLRALDGKFFIKTTKSPSAGTSVIGTNYDDSITWPHLLDDSSMVNNGVSMDFFSVAPSEESNLDLYWEASDDYPISSVAANSEFGLLNSIDWFNCIQMARDATNPPFLEIDKDLDKFNSTPFGKGVRVNTPLEDPHAQRHKNKLIFSGIINPNTNTNRLNQFIKAEGITKDINPKYGSIQKLYAQDNLFAFCHDKIVKILANKDALFNADDSSNLIATPNVLGQAIGIHGEYGICSNPESFAAHGFNIYFTDKNKGKVMQFTPNNGQLNDISKNGLRDFLRDRIVSASTLVGSFDEYSNKYVLSIQGYDATSAAIDSPNILDGEQNSQNANLTIGYHANGQQSGWVSRYSFIPERGVSSLGKYYTLKDGKVWLHHSNSGYHNNFYGTQYFSEVTFIFNDNPTVSSEWVSLNYEGTEGWDVIKIEADQEEGITSSVDILDSTWFKKEGKYFASITGEEPVYSLILPGVPNADGNYPLQDTGQKQPKAGVKGFFNKVTLKNDNITKEELFAISAEHYISSK